MVLLSLRMCGESAIGFMGSWSSLANNSPIYQPRQATRFCIEGRDTFALLFPAFAIFSIVSSKTGFSEHTRYVLPAFPFFYVAIASVTTRYLTRLEGFVDLPTRGPLLGSVSPFLCFSTLVSAFGSWLLLSSLWLYPHSLSYFNELVGGPLNGHKHLLGSNVDWGQDFRYLAWQRYPEDGDRPSLRVLSELGVFDLRGREHPYLTQSFDETKDFEWAAISVNCRNDRSIDVWEHEEFGNIGRIVREMLNRDPVSRPTYSFVLYRTH